MLGVRTAVTFWVTSARFVFKINSGVTSLFAAAEELADEAEADADEGIASTCVTQYDPASSFEQTALNRGVMVYRTSYMRMTSLFGEEPVSSSVQAL